MHKLTKPFICPECNQSFTGKDSRGFSSARFPLILHCGHSACSSCIKQAAKQHKCITCEKCKKATSLPDGEISVDNLIPDLHVVGTLTNLNRAIPRNFKVKFVPAGAPILKEKTVNSTGVRCENCNGNALWKCDKCCTNLCSKCFDKIHNTSKLLKKHTMTGLVEHSYRSTVQAGCQEHEGKAIEFYCEDDGQLACSHCAVTGAHKGHHLVTLLEKNRSSVKDVCKAVEEATKMKRRLKHTENKLSVLLPNAKPSTQVCEQEIRDYFHELHCCLQLREAELLNELSATVTQCVSPLENMYQQVSENIKELTSLLKDADVVIINSAVPINAVELARKLEQSLELPCHLISSGESTKAELHVQLDSNFKDTILNIGKLDTNVEQRFQLVSERELPPNHQVDVIDNESTTTDGDSVSLNGSLTEDVHHPVSKAHKPKVEVKPPKVTVKAKNSKLMQQELVRVKHIKNPCEFWVQRELDISKLKQLTINANRWCRLNKEIVTPSQLVIGELYMVQYGTDENWYRARLKAVVGDAYGTSNGMSSQDETSAANFITPPSEPVEYGVAVSSDVFPSELSETFNDTLLNAVPSEPNETFAASSLDVVLSEPNEPSTASSLALDGTSESDATSAAGDPVGVPSERHGTSGVFSSSVVNSELTVVSKEVGTKNRKSPQADGDFSVTPNLADISSESLKSWADAVEEAESKETSHNISFSNFLVIVQYVDYGNTETVPITRMRMIQSQFLKLPCLALSCALWEIEPNPPSNWSKEAVTMFAKFVGDNDALMRVVDERNNILYVDLCRPAIADIANDVPVSVREALVFMEMAHFPNPQSSTLPSDFLAIHPRYKRKQEFFPADRLPIGQKVNVVVNHVNSPSDFYIQQQGAATSYWNDMTFEIKDYYSNELLNQTLAIFLPTIGMACMANFSLDNQWYRAQVIGLPGGSMVNVFYVDFGNTEVLPCWRLAKIIDKFLKLPVQAVHCSLADVTPVARSGWTEEGIAWFKEATKKNSISMMVHDVPPKERAVVSLFEATELAIRCISGLLVVEGYAHSTGSRSSYTEEQQIVPVHAKSEGQVLFPTEEMPKPPGVKVKKKHNYMAVTCSHFEDPGCLYIQEEEEKNNLKRLMKNLKMACDKMKPSQQKWNEGDCCVVLHSKDKNWYRSRITSIDKNENAATVLLMDYGSSDVVPLDHLRPLEKEFEEDSIFAVKCHLTGMIPAGDTRKWSRSACEFLKETLTSQEVIYLKLKNVCENDSQAVDLFIKEVRKGSALEPTRVVYSSVTEMLVSQGLALPTQRLSKVSKVIPEEEAVVPVPFDSCNDLDNGLSSGSASSSLLSDILLTPPQVGLSWLPPPRLEDNEVVIMPTYIGYDGYINFHLYGEVDIQLKSMRDYLTNIFNATNNVPSNDVIREGQICMAKYDLDEKWYRAEVVKVMKDKMEVLFVDYGEALEVKIEEIRTHVAFIDVPKLCYKAQLYNVKPVSTNGQWPEATLTFINDLVVDKVCNVLIEEYSEDGSEMYITVTLPGNKPLVPVLEQEDLIHVNVCLPICIFEELTRPVSKRVPFEKMPLPPADSIVPVTITKLYETNLVCMQILRIDKPTTLAEQQINEEHDLFLKIVKELDENASGFEMVENPKPGMCCCGLYTEDDTWYRCLVLEQPDATTKKSLVYYVDYGNFESLGVERLRQLPKYYLRFPMQGLICQLHGLKPGGGSDEWSEESRKEMNNVLADDNASKDFQAKIVYTEPPIEVTILTTDPENEENLKVAYESLIENGTVTFSIFDD